MEAALVFLGQGRAEVGVGDADEVLGAVLEGASFEACDAVFGADVVDVVARGADGGAFGEEGLDARDFAAGGGAGHGDDGLALAGERGAADEVHLAADAAVLADADGLAGHLPLQVHLEAGVDGDHAVVLRDDEGVVDVVDRVKLHVGVLVDEVVELACAHDEGDHGLAAVEGLAAAVDDAAAHEVHHAAGEHLAVDAEVVLVGQRAQDGVGDGADAELEGGAVGHERGAVAPDGELHLARGGQLQLLQAVGAGDDVVDLRHMDQRVAVGEGHQLVGLDDDGLGGADGGLGVVAADAERAIALGVGGRGLEDGHVARYVAADHRGHILEVGGEEVALAALDHLARVGGQEVAHVAEVAEAVGLVAGVVAEGGHVVDEDVVVVLAVVGQRLLHQARRSGGMAHDDTLAVADGLDGLGGLRDFLAVFFFPVHDVGG